MTVKCLLAGLALALSPLPALAANDVCIDPRTGQVDMQATAGWQQFQAGANPQAMQALTGVWYAEIPNPATGQVDFRYHIFEPNGLFQYQSRVCSRDGLCSDFQGHGFWASQMAQDGTVATMSIISDLSRSNVCGIGYARFVNQTTLADSNGIRWTKVR